MTMESIPGRSRNGSAVETRPTALVPTYRDEFALVLPRHVDPSAFVQMALSALRRSKDLTKAAENDPGSLIHALRDAARLGHLPGTENYYLTPKGGKVLGIEGYQGVVERMYRAGAAQSIRVELVCSNDRFRFDPGTMDRPMHEVDWFDDRGDIRGAYAYAILTGGAVSKVVVVGPREIARSREASATSGSRHSPWVTDYAAMTMKTAALRLEPWVPTSSEFLAETLRVRAAAERIAEANPVVPVPDEPEPDGEATDGVVLSEDGIDVICIDCETAGEPCTEHRAIA